MTLVFYEKSHRYKLDGQWIPGVTTLIKQGRPNKALTYWAPRMVAEWVADNPSTLDEMRRRLGRGPIVAALKEIPWQIRDTAGERGTEVHAIAQRIITGEEVDVPHDLVGYVTQALRFMDDWGIEPLLIEGRVAHRADWWAGTGDLWASCRDGRTAYFDYKTAASGVWPDTAYQACAYTHAEFVAVDDQEQPLPKVDFAAAVWLQEDTYQVIPLKADGDVYEEFLHMKAVAAAGKRSEGSKTEAGYVGYALPTPGGDE